MEGTQNWGREALVSQEEVQMFPMGEAREQRIKTHWEKFQMSEKEDVLMNEGD